MKRLLLLAVAALGVACGAPSYTVTATAATPTPVLDVFSCVRTRLETLGFRQSSLDVDAHRVTARRYDETVRRPDVRFRRMVDVLEIEIQADAAGQTGLVVAEKTFAEYFTERGPTLEQETTSERARAAGQSVLDACGR